MSRRDTTPTSWPLPAFATVSNFLDESQVNGLLDWVFANQNAFRPAEIVDDHASAGGLVSPSFRIASTLRDIGPERATIERRLWAALPTLERETGCKSGSDTLELELAAHGDGAHYRPHLDISYGPGRRPIGASNGQDRVLSAVYYFYREPKGFSGGALRLYRFGARPAEANGDPSNWVDVEPHRNSLVAFPSFALHEVLNVDCPSGSFENFRFALNCWFCRTL